MTPGDPPPEPVYERVQHPLETQIGVTRSKPYRSVDEAITETVTVLDISPADHSWLHTDASGSGSGSESGSTQSPEAAAAVVATAELAVTSAQKALSATRLRAPMSGTIAAVNASVGDTMGTSSSSSSSAGAQDTAASSSASSSFITLAKLHRFKIEVSLSESDIGKVKKGQAATMTVNAVSGLKLAGHVTSVGVLTSATSSSSTASSSSSSSAVSYPVTITMDQSSSRAKAGMSASADIVTGQASGLTVPTQALSGSTVTVVKGSKRTTTRVETGLEGDSSTQILSGLKAGDQVAVTSTARRSSTPTSASRARAPQPAAPARRSPASRRAGRQLPPGCAPATS